MTESDRPLRKDHGALNLSPKGGGPDFDMYTIKAPGKPNWQAPSTPGGSMSGTHTLRRG